VGGGGLQLRGARAGDDPVAKLKKAKEMLDLGLITQDDYDKLKAKALGL
ncbi:SHOCT domain-containing protein, partial [Stenotrophomonas sp.]